MGRLQGTRARVLLTVVLTLAIPLAVLATDRLTMSSGAPGVSLTLAIVVVHLLSIGPRGAPLAWAAFAVHGAMVGGNDPSVGLAVVAAVQAAVTVAGVRLVEVRFAHHGPVRRPGAMIDFGLVAGGAVPVLVAAIGVHLAPLVGAEPWQGPVLQHALADGIGVLAVAAGLRMVVFGERISLDGPAVRSIVAAVAVTLAAVVATLALGGVDVLASSQVLLLPILLVALLSGIAAYAIAMALTTVGLVAAVAVIGVAEPWSISTPMQAVWWFVAVGGLLLATDGDRRRAAAVEFRTFFMRSATPSVSVNASEGTIIRANKAVAELLDRRVEELVGSPLMQLVDHEPEVAAGLERVMAGEALECTEEFVLRSDSGTERWVRCMAARVDLGGPQHDVLQVQFVDLTAERARQGSLERSNEALERFGRRVTHDLKQPLSAVAAYASTLAEHAEQLDPAVVRTMYDRLEAVARRAITQLDETFAASRAADGDDTPVDLGEVVTSILGVIDIDLAETGASVETALSVKQVHADSSTVRQVLLNLVTNSLKYADDATPTRIRVASRVRGAGVEITVTDNGTGIPAEALEAVFERGRRLDPDRADGRGHGLADSRELAEAAGGWLLAEPWPDGARFVLWLPDPALAGGAATRVLLVDDEEDELTMLRTRLEVQPSIDVVGTATSIQGAVEAAQDLRPDVIVLDRWLRGEDGLRGVVELARAHPDVRIILLTADVTPDLPERARSDGVLRTVDKAVSDEDLVAHLVGETTR